MGETGDEALGTHAGHWADWDPGVATGLAERLSPAAAGMHTVHMYMYNFRRWTVILLSRRGEQDEATSAVGVYVSAGHIGLHRSVRLAVCTCVCCIRVCCTRVRCIRALVCAPMGNTHSTSLLGGPGGLGAAAASPLRGFSPTAYAFPFSLPRKGGDFSVPVGCRTR